MTANCKSSSSRSVTVVKSIAESCDGISHALRACFTTEEVFNLTTIDRWFLVQIKEIVDFEEELAGPRH